MRAYITSIEEPTTDLCKWSLIRNGFKPVITISGKTSLAMKLHHIYNDVDEDFVRVDADVVPNKNLTPEFLTTLAQKDVWWVQYMTFDWFKQDLTPGGVQYIKKEAIAALRANIKDAIAKERPETYLYRIAEFHNPRRCLTNHVVMGLQNYHNDMERIKATKIRRNQAELYDFELAERINSL